MSSVGPKELYMNDKQAVQFAKLKEEQYIDWFKNLNNADRVEECANWDAMRHNALMNAAKASGPTLVKYIVDNLTDKRVLMMSDNEGMSALYHAINGLGSVNKVKECVRLLIDGGADPDRKSGFKWPPAKLPAKLDELPPEGKLSNVVGILIAKLENEQNNKWSYNQTAVDYWADRLALFISVVPQATCYISEIGEVDTEPCTPEEQPQSANAKELLSNYKMILIKARTTALWEKLNMRLLFLGAHDQNSPLNQIPYEIVTLMSQKFISA